MSDYLPRKSSHRPRSTILKPIKEQQSFSGGLSKDEAATRIQSALRGFTSRRTVERSEARELVFLGMQPRASLGDNEPTAQDAAAEVAQKISQEQMQRLYRASLVSQRSELLLVEGMAIREALQEKINTWVTSSRGPDGDQIPKYPSEAEGGSKSFLEPVPLVPPTPGAEQAKGRQPGRAAPAAAKGKEVPNKAGANKSAQPVELPSEIQHAHADDLAVAIKEWQDRWADRDEPGAGAWAAQQLDKELLKAEVRPSVEEQIRLQSDEEMRMLLGNIKEMAAAELTISRGNKAKGKAKDAKGQKKVPAKAAAKEQGKRQTKTPAPEKKRKDITADRTIDELYAELASAQLVQPCPRMRLAEFLGAPDLSARGLTPGDVAADPSLADVRAAVTAFCILPLASSYVHDRVGAVRSLLLYGAKGTGKTMLVHAIAHESGACFFNLSPRHTDGKYQGKAACSLMVHMVFKVAKAMAPSVIYIDEAEKVFIMDKRKAEEHGGIETFNRIKRDLLAEIAALAPTDRVLVIGTSSEPFNCKRRDEAALGSAFDKLFYVPLPDYASRQVLWSGLVEKHGVPLQKGFDMSTVVCVSEGYSAGGLEQVLMSIMADRQQSQMKAALTADDVLQKLRDMPPISADTATELKEWKMHTPVYKAITEGDKDEAADKNKSKNKTGPKKA
ncbi:g7133 [Coccomyxa elongata]